MARFIAGSVSLGLTIHVRRVEAVVSGIVTDDPEETAGGKVVGGNGSAAPLREAVAKRPPTIALTIALGAPLFSECQ